MKSHNKTIVQSIVEELRFDIIAGQFKPAEKLTEQKLAERYGASRIPVREAVRQLEIEGYIERKNYSSTNVKEITYAEFIEKSEVIYELISYLAPRAIANYTKETIAGLTKFVPRIHNVKDYKDWCTTMLDLSECVYLPAQRPAFIKIIKDIFTIYLRLAYPFFSLNSNQQQNAAVQLQKFIDLCIEGKIEEATQNRLMLILKIRESLTKTFVSQ